MSVKAHQLFDLDQAVVWQSHSTWTDLEKQAKLHVALHAHCQEKLVAEYELDYWQRAPRSKPKAVSESSFAHQRPVSWASDAEKYNQFLKLLSWYDPVYLDDEFAQAMGFPKRIINDFFVFAALWFETQTLCPSADELSVVCAQPAVASTQLNLLWNDNGKGKLEGRLLDELERPVFANFNLSHKEGV
jgi:hypothetical protein